jgi:anti-sigma B factor antagonist
MRSDDGSNAGSADSKGRPAEIESSRDRDSVVVAVGGEIDLLVADQLDTAIRGAQRTKLGGVVVDLSEMSFVDSTALEVLLEAVKRDRSDGKRLRFIPSRHESVARLFALTCTTELFE